MNDIEVEPKYRRAGIAQKMFGQVERYSNKHQASEIYGTIDSASARDFWQNQAKNGWNIRKSNSFYGEVYELLL